MQIDINEVVFDGDAVNCFVCDGTGFQRDWNDRDPIEGWKLAARYKCSFCSNGQIKKTDKRFKAVLAYKQVMDTVEEAAKRLALEKEQKRLALIQQAKSKLTIEEFEALGVDVG